MGAAAGQEAESLEELAPSPTAKGGAKITFEEAEEQAWNEIEAYLRSMPAYDMQDLVANLLTACSRYPALRLPISAVETPQ